MKYAHDRIRGLEFVGLPGSGKTTVMLEAQNRVQAEGRTGIFTNEDLNSWKKHQGSLGKARLLLSDPLFAAVHFQKALAIALSLDTVDLRTCKRVIEMPLYYLYVHKIMSESSRFIITDQWVIQSVWSFAALSGKYSQGLLLNYTRTALRLSPFAYVYIKASPEVAAERIALRANGGSRFDSRRHGENIPRLARANKLLELMLQLMQEEEDKVLVLDAEEEITHKADKVVEFMSRFAKQPVYQLRNAPA